MDDFWGWINAQFGNILGVLGLVTGFWFYWLSRKPKRFGWQTISKTKIMAHQSEVLPLQVMYAGREVTSPNILVVRIGNTGKAVIHAADFDGPVKITFGISTLLSFTFSSSDEGISVAVEQDLNSLACKLSMLNPGEWVEFQFVTDGPLEVPEVHARVAGQNGPTPNMSDLRRRTWQPVVYSGLALAFTGILLTIVMGRFFEVGWGWISLSGIGLGLLVWAASRVDVSSGWAKTPKAGKRINS
ncbi:hypothetical protein QF038_001848 [Pseudarthrobacter sp. W1I19]|uniref:hypothetical protein n=1 Tax=Pseudarthrobacter sp. W1I19 TaxID=3042288 RepID=UPI002780E67F|nr:hypothetical protein [Pseudarthrobacter sp. W1I19]MDQ0923340.1 hypothetical protein [Pseudarthrobacter sp. W1I19]